MISFSFRVTAMQAARSTSEKDQKSFRWEQDYIRDIIWILIILSGYTHEEPRVTG
jgi:hypothetical protein